MELIQIEADNTPDEGSETFSVQLMSASFLGFPLDVSDTELQYTIQDGRFVFLKNLANDNIVAHQVLNRAVKMADT